MTLMRLICLALAIGFGTLCVWAALNGDFTGTFASVWALPWGKVAMVDLYLGFALAGIVIFAVEKLPIALPIFIATVLLGNLVLALWFAARLPLIWRKLKANDA